MIRCKLLLFLLACTYCIAAKNGKNEQDEYLYNNVIANLGKKHHCQDMYSFACEKLGPEAKDLTSAEYWKAVKHAEYILSSNDARGYASIAEEQKLFKECLRYGHENKEELEEIKEKVKLFEESLLDVVKKNYKWQKVDHKLAKLGFGYAFFDIKVVRDPLDSRKKIIMLEPPSLMSLNNLLISLENISEVDLDAANLTDNTSIISLYKAMKLNGLDLIRRFVASLIGSVQETSSLDRTKILSEKMTIGEWSKKYNRKSTNSSPKTEINWPEIIFHEFFKVKVNLYDSEPIIVKNIHYFSRLFNNLFEVPNDIIGAVVVAKAATQNLRYIDYEFAQILHNRDRASFCKTETKLYGVSHKVLFDLCKDTIDKKQTRKIQEIVYNILEEVKSTISEARFSFAEESYLLSELQDIITHIGFLAELQNIANNEGLENWSPSSVPEYYDTFNRSNSYFNNIINYREMVRMKELRSLRSPSHTLLYTPFSLLDIHVPANRFIMNVFFNRALLQSNYYKEQVFGTYGAKLAILIYGLLNENKALDNSYYSYDLTANPDFVLEETNCIDFEEFNVTYNAIERNMAISSSVGLDIAFNAMSKPISNKVVMPKITNPLPFKTIWKSDQIFFLSFSMAHCNWNNYTLNDAVYHSTKYSSAECFPYCHSQCKYMPFNYVDKNIFLIKM